MRADRSGVITEAEAKRLYEAAGLRIQLPEENLRKLQTRVPGLIRKRGYINLLESLGGLEIFRGMRTEPFLRHPHRNQAQIWLRYERHPFRYGRDFA